MLLTYSEIEAKYEIHVKCVLQKLHEADLQADIIKCTFHVKEISLSQFWHVSTGSVTGLSVRQRKCCSESSVIT